VVFFAVFVATFPYDDALQGLLRPSGLSFTSASQGWNIPFGARFEDAAIVLDRDGWSPLIESPDLRVTPSLAAFVTGARGVRLSAQAYGGDLSVLARQGETWTAVEFRADGIDLARYPRINSNGLSVGGMLSAAGHADLNREAFDANDGTIEVAVQKLAITPGFGLPRVNFGDLVATVTLRGGVLTIDGLRTFGGDVALNADGTVELSPEWTESALDLRLRVTPDPRAAERLGVLIRLLPPRPDNRPYLIGGTLGEPVMN
jgi:type II secretion system protein N